MSSPIPIRYPARSSDASASSLGLYVPVHRRTPGSYTSSSSRTPSPSPSSSRAFSPSPSLSSSPASTHHTLPPLVPGVYTPAELLLLSGSPLAKLSTSHVDALRTIAPEVVQTRRQRKALAWHARQPRTGSSSSSPTHERASSRGSHTSESEEDKATTWRRI